MTFFPDGATALERARTLVKPKPIQPPPTHRPTEFVLTGRPKRGEPISAVFRRLAEDLAAREADLLTVMIYGSIAAKPEIESAMRNLLGEPNWPITWVEGASCDGSPLAGVQAFAISRREIARVRLGGRVVASVYEDGGARHCLLGGIGPRAKQLRPAAQVQQTFANLESALDLAGFAPADLVRTWFYNDDIVAWYPEFNRVRTSYYAGVSFRTAAMPASTGIGARNPAATALTLAAWAMQPIEASARAFAVASPLQCPAPAYGSSFSRAMEIDSGGARRLLISGTASIHPGGETAWVGNARKQVELTMEVIDAILHARGMTFRDVTRATAYFEHALFKPYLDAWLAARQLTALPIVSTRCDICRADLLFELELDACVTNEG